MTAQMPQGLTGAEKAARVEEYRAHANGSERMFRHWTGHLVYTSGVQLVAETCGAHWWVDAIASHQKGIAKRHGRLGGHYGAAQFQVWRLSVKSWTLTRDGKHVRNFPSDFEAAAWLHRTHSFSVSHALAHEGYALDPGAWTLEAWSDTPGAEGSVMLAHQAIPYSDFPRELAPFEAWCEFGVLMLKEER